MYSMLLGVRPQLMAGQFAYVIHVLIAKEVSSDDLISFSLKGFCRRSYKVQ